jgi:hypothetical protein
MRSVCMARRVQAEKVEEKDHLRCAKLGIQCRVRRCVTKQRLELVENPYIERRGV